MSGGVSLGESFTKMKTKLCLVLFIPGLALAAQSAGPAVPNAAQRANCVVTSLSPATPTTLPAADLIAAIEEERMAHDVYVAAAAKWNLPVFTRIAQAESQHEAALVRLAATANMTIPVAQPGIYATAELQELHTSLMALANESATGALKAAALIEETDISDLRRLRASATDEPTRAMLANLERASSRHLSAFVRNLAAQGITYAPQVLTADDYSASIGAPGHGRGMRRGSGPGNGRGVCDGTGPGLGRGFDADNQAGGYRGGR